eukprot:GHVU01179773.1.p1 GENE.GHVU01179773.1~~GHVU01179773.1.p1  ORF type:complete len:522 (+),score=25.76 GHVU01179773.1:200-1567(+)
MSPHSSLNATVSVMSPRDNLSPSALSPQESLSPADLHLSPAESMSPMALSPHHSAHNNLSPQDSFSPQHTLTPTKFIFPPHQNLSPAAVSPHSMLSPSALSTTTLSPSGLSPGAVEDFQSWGSVDSDYSWEDDAHQHMCHNLIKYEISDPGVSAPYWQEHYDSSFYPSDLSDPCDLETDPSLTCTDQQIYSNWEQATCPPQCLFEGRWPAQFQLAGHFKNYQKAANLSSCRWNGPTEARVLDSNVTLNERDGCGCVCHPCQERYHPAQYAFHPGSPHLTHPISHTRCGADRFYFANSSQDDTSNLALLHQSGALAGRPAGTAEQPITRAAGGATGHRRRKRKNPQLWEFLLTMLQDKRYNPELIRWENAHQGIFKFVKSQKFAKLWGERKKKGEMTYEHLSRALRHYYKQRIMARTTQRLVYQFQENACGWKLIASAWLRDQQQQQQQQQQPTVA